MFSPLSNMPSVWALFSFIAIALFRPAVAAWGPGTQGPGGPLEICDAIGAWGNSGAPVHVSSDYPTYTETSQPSTPKIPTRGRRQELTYPGSPSVPSAACGALPGNAPYGGYGACPGSPPTTSRNSICQTGLGGADGIWSWCRLHDAGWGSQGPAEISLKCRRDTINGQTRASSGTSVEVTVSWPAGQGRRSPGAGDVPEARQIIWTFSPTPIVDRTALSIAERGAYTVALDQGVVHRRGPSYLEPEEIPPEPRVNVALGARTLTLRYYPSGSTSGPVDVYFARP